MANDISSSILLTNNRSTNEWSDLFLDILLASKGPDHLLGWTEVVIIHKASHRAQGRARTLEQLAPE